MSKVPHGSADLLGEALNGIGNPKSPEKTPAVSTRNLRKRFQSRGAEVRAIDDISLDVQQGEFLVLLGPSGCGKTTLLRSIAGLEQPDSGTIEIGGRPVFSSELGLDITPAARNLGMVFQSYALWPHMSVFDNVVYPLRSRRATRVGKKEAAERVHRVLEQVGIPELGGRYPNEISGGQQQRVALARALVAGNNLVLFDEPLSNVDAKVRQQLRRELMAMQESLGFSAIYVTHDQVEAMELADRIAVLSAGKVLQLGTPREVYEAANSRYVADFIGTANELAGTVREVNGPAVTVRTELGSIHGVAGSGSLNVGDSVVAVFRPERCLLDGEASLGGNQWQIEIESMFFAGPHTEYVVSANGAKFNVWTTDAETMEPGSSASVSISAGEIRVFAV